MSDKKNNSEEKRIHAEEGRSVAERQRREAEKGRVVAESGRQLAEENQGTGRVEAEVKRVIAEEGRAAAQRSLKHYVRRAIAGYLILAVGMVAGLYASYRASDLVNEGRVEARFVLCVEVEKVKEARRDELREKIRVSEDFLKNNPDGIPGIPAELFEESVARDKRALDSLKSLNCDHFSKNPKEYSEEIKSGD